MSANEDDVSIAPTSAPLSDEIQKAIQQETGAFFERLERTLSDAPAPAPQGQLKSYQVDPFAMLDSVGMGYKANPSNITYETLRQMTERDTLMGAIVSTRRNQVSTFCMEQENKYSIGNLVRLRGKDRHKRRLTNGERDRVKKIEHYIQNMGVSQSLTRDGFVNAMKKMVIDTLTFDQVNYESQNTRGGDLHQTVVVDPATIRLADISKWNPTGQPISKADEHSRPFTAQIINGQIVREFTATEMAFCIRNPRSNIRVAGYGFPEPQALIQTVTSHIWAEEWNRKAFSQGSTIKGVLNMKGNIDRQKYDAFKRQWMAQVGGITNAWKTPIMNSDGIEFVPMQMSNTEMGYQMWIEYLVKIACAIYQMDPTEINFDLRGGGGAGQQPTFMSGNEAQQKMSKDRGLKPLLRFFEEHLNRNIVHRIDPGFEIAFVGLDAKSEEQSIELRQKQGQTMLTVNELRALEDLDPIPGGDVIMNPTFTGYLLQSQQAQQQGGGGGQPGAPGGDDGQDQNSQPPEQPYQGRFGFSGDPQAESGKEGGKALQQSAKGPKQQDEHHEDHDIRMLKRNDWESTIHSSVRDNDLKKSTNAVADLFWDIET